MRFISREKRSYGFSWWRIQQLWNKKIRMIEDTSHSVQDSRRCENEGEQEGRWQTFPINVKIVEGKVKIDFFVPKGVHANVLGQMWENKRF